MHLPDPILRALRASLLGAALAVTSCGSVLAAGAPEIEPMDTRAPLSICCTC